MRSGTVLHPLWASTLPPPPALRFWQEELHKEKCLRQVPTFSTSPQGSGEGPSCREAFQMLILAGSGAAAALFRPSMGLRPTFSFRNGVGRLPVEASPCHVCTRCSFSPLSLGRVGCLFQMRETYIVRGEGNPKGPLQPPSSIIITADTYIMCLLLS